MSIAIAAMCHLHARGDEPPEPWIIAATPEAPDAVANGKAEVERAQALAKNKDYRNAIPILESVARKFPSALHDCNLALLYLRTSALTKAQLMFDIAAARNSPTRPTWCIGDLSVQLATAMQAASYVPLTIDISDPGAIVTAGGVVTRDVHVLWLPQGMATIHVEKRGKTEQTRTVDVVPPSSRIAIVLPEAGQEFLGSDGKPRNFYSLPVDAAVPDAPPPPDAPTVVETPVKHAVEAPSRVPLFVSAGVAIAATVTGSVFAWRASDARDDANALYPTDPKFATAKDKFSTYRGVALGGFGLGAVAAGALVYFLMSGDSTSGDAGPVGIVVSPDGTIGLSVGGKL